MPPSVWGIHDTVTPDDLRATGCGWHRIILPFGQLQTHGWDTRYGPGKPGLEADPYRIIVAERLDRPDVLGDWRRLRARHRLVYEIDDDVFTVDQLNLNAYRVYSNPIHRDAVSHCAEIADLVTVTTEPLAEVMREHNPEVRVLPNYIPEEMLSIHRTRWAKTGKNRKVTLGWAGGASHTWDVALIAESVRNFLESHADVELHLIGCDFRKTFCRKQTRFTEWDYDHHKYYRNIDFDIGLAPLRGTVFDASKSYLKALEYAALGIPVIASDVEAYRGFVIDGVTGFLCRTQKQWRKALRDLVHDDGLRESMGEKAREHARDFTYEGHWQRWAEVYKELI
jgi:glycosyltransferase involved in cell wall biosynthesis